MEHHRGAVVIVERRIGVKIIVYSYYGEQVFARLAVFRYQNLTPDHVFPFLLVLQLLGEVGAYHHLLQTVAAGVESASLSELYVQHVEIVVACHIQVGGVKHFLTGFWVNYVVAAAV